MKYKLNSNQFTAKNCVDGILIDPALPKYFDNTKNEDRPYSQGKWWYLPYIVTACVKDTDTFIAECTDEYAEQRRISWAANRAEFMARYPSGIQYTVRCLDGGAWDRSTNYGVYSDLDTAVDAAKEIASRYKTA